MLISFPLLIQACETLVSFALKWRKTYPRAIKSLESNEHLLTTFYEFPQAIWRSIYSTNLIEPFNKQLKKYSKQKEQFPNESSIGRFIVSQFEPYNQKFSTRCHLGFDLARAELNEMFQKKKRRNLMTHITRNEASM